MSKKKLGQKAGYTQTTDAALAAVIIGEGYQIVDCYKVEFGRYAYVFVAEDEIVKIKERYGNGLYSIEPGDFYQVLKTVFQHMNGVKK